MTASECESDEEGALHHRSPRDSKSVTASSTTKLSLQFSINKVNYDLHFLLSSIYTPRSSPRLAFYLASTISLVDRMLRGLTSW